MNERENRSALCGERWVIITRAPVQCGATPDAPAGVPLGHLHAGQHRWLVLRRGRRLPGLLEHHAHRRA